MQFSLFSHKFSHERGIIQLMDDLGSAINSNHDLCMLGGGNPAHISAMEQYFRDEMIRLLNDGKCFEKIIGDYDSPLGNVKFRQALCENLNRQYGWEITIENIAISNGSQAAFGFIFNLFAGEYKDGSNKKILLPLAPEYIGYSNVGLGPHDLFTTCKPKIKLLDNGMFKYRIDFEQLEVKDEIGAICVSRPTNPTGNVLTDNEIDHLHQLAQEMGIPLIIDGAYGIPFPEILFTPATLTWDKNIVLCLSLSKLGLPGVRTGIIIAAKPLIDLLGRSNAIFNLAPGRFGPSLMTHLVGSDKLTVLCQQHIKPFYQTRSKWAIDRIRELMADLPVRIHVAEGAIFLWLWCQDLPISSEQLYQRLKKLGVLVISGHHFFPGLKQQWLHKHQCIRITYAADQHQVNRGLEIIAQQLRVIYSII